MSRVATFAVLGGLTAPGFAQSPEPLTGHWQVTGDIYGTTFYQSLDLTQQGGKLAGKFGEDKLEGTVDGNSVHFVSRNEDNDTDEVSATLAYGKLTGTLIETEAQNLTHPTHMSFTAVLAPRPTKTAPQRHEFTPTVFYREFSPLNKPVLNLNPGDILRTTTVDAGGTDEHSEQRVAGGNPEQVRSTSPGPRPETHSSCTSSTSNSIATGPNPMTTWISGRSTARSP